jgi:hypothetical protein
MGKPPQLAVPHEVATCEPQEEQGDKETAETAVAAATETASRLVGFRVGGRGMRSLGSSLVAGWGLIREYRFHLCVHLAVGVGSRRREEILLLGLGLGRLSRRHDWDKRARAKRAKSGEYINCRQSENCGTHHWMKASAAQVQLLLRSSCLSEFPDNAGGYAAPMCLHRTDPAPGSSPVPELLIIKERRPFLDLTAHQESDKIKRPTRMM